MLITVYYHVFDKLGVYLNNTLNLNLERPYYKKIVDKIINEKLSCNELVNSICDLRNGQEYIELNKIRQIIIHEKKSFVDYKKNLETLSSLVVSNLVDIQNVVYMISNDFFKKNSLKVSEQAKNEAKMKTLIKKL